MLDPSDLYRTGDRPVLFTYAGRITSSKSVAYYLHQLWFAYHDPTAQESQEDDHP